MPNLEAVPKYISQEYISEENFHICVGIQKRLLKGHIPTTASDYVSEPHHVVMILYNNENASVDPFDNTTNSER